MKPSCMSVAAALVLSAAASATAQQFDLRMRTPARPGLLARDGGIAIDVDQSGSVDLLQKGGSVLMADGNLGFLWSPPGARIATVGGIPNFFELAGDVDGNGIVDLISLGVDFATLTTNVLVTFGSAGGYWGQRVPAGAMSGWDTSLLLRDFDGDAVPDLLLRRLYPTAGLGLLRNQGNGTFVDVTTSSLPAIPLDGVVAMADATGDGAPDLFVRSNGLLTLLFHVGAGVFVPVPSGLPAVSALQGLYCADADADGDQDLLVATTVGAPLQLWLGTGSGTFVASTMTLPSAGTGHAFADLDNDQRAELLVIRASPLGQQLQALRNAGTQFLLASAALVDTAMDLGEPVLADIESDGDRDVVLGGSLVFLNGGNLQFAALQRYPLAEVTIEDAVAAGDVDGDEVVDLVIGDTLHLNDGDGYFTNLGVTLPVGARGRALADLDNDGDLDLVWTRATQTVLDCGVMVNQNGALVASTALGTWLRGRVEAVDFDNDGLLDLVSEGGLALRNLGGLSFSPAASLAFPERFLTLGDFDADGAMDIVTTQPAGWTVWRNVGNFVFSSTGGPQPGSVVAAVVGHFDNDGRLDLATSYPAAIGGASMRALRVWTQSATGWVAGPVLPDGPMANSASPLGLAAADFDEDGDLDLVAQGLWLNSGGLFTSVSGGVLYSTPLTVADLDGDRDLDIVRAAELGTAEPRRCSVFVNRLRDLDADRLPTLGYTHTITVASRAGSGIGGDVVVAAVAATRIPATSVPGLGLLHVDPQSIGASLLGITGQDGLCSFAVPLPLQPSLAGLEIYWQGAVIAGSSLRLTSLLIDRLLP